MKNDLNKLEKSIKHLDKKISNTNKKIAKIESGTKLSNKEMFKRYNNLRSNKK